MFSLDKEVAGNEEGNTDNTDTAAEDIDAAATNDAPANDKNDYATMPPKTMSILTKAATKKESAAAAAMPPPPTAAAAAAAATSFSIKAEDPLTVSYYADGVYDYANVVFFVNGTMQKGEYQVRVAKDGLSVSFGRAICSSPSTRRSSARSWARSTATAALASSLGTTRRWRCNNRMCTH